MFYSFADINKPVEKLCKQLQMFFFVAKTPTYIYYVLYDCFY